LSDTVAQVHGVSSQLLFLALNSRSSFFKIWNRLSRSEATSHLSWDAKLEAALAELNPASVGSLPQGIRFISLVDEDYPSDLRELPQPPLGLFVQGSWTPDSARAAVIGSRKPTPYSLRMAYRCSQLWAQRGFTVVSGGALGVDSEAHRAAVDQEAVTWVVLGGGLLRLHPRSNQGLFEGVLRSGGALVSEYPPHWEPRAYFFPERNRLIAALSHVLFLAQAHEKSGSLSTARMALDLGREIFVLKPPLGDESFAGSQKLIELGARSLINPEELLREPIPEISPLIDRP
jgi:DNA processing protein